MFVYLNISYSIICNLSYKAMKQCYMDRYNALVHYSNQLCAQTVLEQTQPHPNMAAKSVYYPLITIIFHTEFWGKKTLKTYIILWEDWIFSKNIMRIKCWLLEETRSTLANKTSKQQKCLELNIYIKYKCFFSSFKVFNSAKTNDSLELKNLLKLFCLLMQNSMKNLKISANTNTLMEYVNFTKYT